MIHSPVISFAALNVAGTSTTAALFAFTEQVNMAMIFGVVSITTGFFTTYFAYKAKTISQEAKEVSQHTGIAVDGKMEEFKKMAEAFYHAQGMIAGRNEAESKAAVVALAKAEGVLEGHVSLALSPAPAPVPVEVVATDPIPVTVKKPATPGS